MFDQKINLQLFGEEDFTDISGAEVSESAEDTAESMESVAETTAEDNADDDGESNAPPITRAVSRISDTGRISKLF